MAKVIGIILVILLIVVLVLFWQGAKFFMSVAMVRKNNWYHEKGHVMLNPSIVVTEKSVYDLREEEQNVIGDAFWQSHRTEVVEETSHDGLKLKGSVFETHPQNHIWALCIHGYRSSGKRDMQYVVSRFSDMGFNTLVPDLRGHGESEGEVIGLGILDKADIMLWLDWILAKDPEAHVMIFGCSMGATAVMLASGEHLPDGVKVIVADCGFTSAYLEFSSLLKRVFKLPAFPLMPMANRIAYRIGGYHLTDTDVRNALSKNHLPSLFIHGTGDKFVPHEMVYVNMEASKGEKELLIVEDAPHYSSFIYDPELYFHTVETFAGEYLDLEKRERV